ncbi:MAG: LysR family transcriptional regulator [Pseudomonadota bacterium]
MDIKRLKIFVAIVEEGGFSAAARKLHVAQPAISIAVRKLEQELDVTLFDPESGRKILTYEGERLYQRARQVLQDVGLLEEEMQGLRGMLSGQLSLACPSMVATYFLPDLLGQFMSRYPQLTASISQYGTQHIEEKLRNREIDLGVIVGKIPKHDTELDVVPLLEERLCLAVSDAHPLAARRFVRYESLGQMPMFIYESGYFIREAFMQECARAGVEPDLRIKANFLPLLIKMARDGAGATLGLQIMKGQEPGVSLLPLVPATTLILLLAKPKGKKISIANQAFFDWLVACPSQDTRQESPGKL